MTNTRLKIITTGDGSHSLLREDLNETYHSFHGAKGESLHVFIQHGVKYVLEKFGNKKSLRVFEVGFGTGLNAFLTAQFAEEKGIEVSFHSLEPIPVPEEIYSQLNFGETEEEKSLLQQIHLSEWERTIRISASFLLAKFQSSLEDFAPQPESFDAVYFDAFAPSKQGEVWQLDNLIKCHSLLIQGGILTTYCAQGQFKRNLASAGFEVETLKGAMGKKEMVRGVKV